MNSFLGEIILRFIGTKSYFIGTILAFIGMFSRLSEQFQLLSTKVDERRLKPSRPVITPL